MENISIRVNAHSIPNLDAASVSSIKIANSEHLKIVDPKLVDEPCKLRYFNPETSLKSRHYYKHFFNCLVLSCNLLLKETALSRCGLALEPSSEGSASRSKVEHTEHGEKISNTGVDSVSDIWYLVPGHPDTLYENEILELSQKISSLKKEISSLKLSSLKKVDSEIVLRANNLDKSLNMYEEGMSSFNEVIVCRDLYSSLELATSCERSIISGEKLKEKMARVSGNNVCKIDALRRFYNRTKHVDDDLEAVTLYREGLKNIGPKITCLRQGAQKAIISQLRKYNFTNTLQNGSVRLPDT